MVEDESLKSYFLGTLALQCLLYEKTKDSQFLKSRVMNIPSVFGDIDPESFVDTLKSFMSHKKLIANAKSLIQKISEMNKEQFKDYLTYYISKKHPEKAEGVLTTLKCTAEDGFKQYAVFAIPRLFGKQSISPTLESNNKIANINTELAEIVEQLTPEQIIEACSQYKKGGMESFRNIVNDIVNMNAPGSGM